MGSKELFLHLFIDFEHVFEQCLHVVTVFSFFLCCTFKVPAGIILVNI